LRFQSPKPDVGVIVRSVFHTLYLWHRPQGEQRHIDHHVLRMQVVAGKPADGQAKSVLCGLAIWVFGIEFFLGVLPRPDPLPGRWQHTVFRPTKIAGPGGMPLVIEWGAI